MPHLEEFSREFEKIRPRLFALAYKITHRLADAEDVLQNVFLAIAQHPASDIKNDEAYLIRSVTNRSLSLLDSRHRTVYPGPDLPEPLIEDRFPDLQGFDVSYGLMILLQKLNPVERAVFVLRETMDFEYAELSDILSLKEENCRQLFHRAREKIKSGQVRNKMSAGQVETFFEIFIRAAKNGDLNGLKVYLKKDITIYADGGGKVSAASRPVLGRTNCMAYLIGLYRKFAEGFSFEPAVFNGYGGLMVREKSTGKADTVLIFSQDGDTMEAIYIIRNPDKLTGCGKSSL